MFLFVTGGQVTFREFLKSEFSDENIDFWLACEDYKKSQSEFLPVKAEKIYKEFVQTDAIKQVSCKSEDIRRLSQIIFFKKKNHTLYTSTHYIQT